MSYICNHRVKKEIVFPDCKTILQLMGHECIAFMPHFISLQIHANLSNRQELHNKVDLRYYHQ